MRTRKAKSESKINPCVVLACISKNHEFLPSVPNYGGYSIEEDIYRVRVEIAHTKTKHKFYSELAKKYSIPNISEALLKEILNESKQKKFRERSSPPFSANKLCNAIMPGNDKNMYKSEKNTSGVCTWILK